ncbi:UPF0149 family protein [Thalassotalea sp. 1_MG-2023]|uniref:UPF0149 family protein n=1 Tax=Thalassotalea sp. 1_MG-2023 TaxID=3062680 RepID=UPI0026E3A1D6|nr:UPF0149 family protein [Thalassotalea sp. 1_MG-2023]MDO6426795.1 UPF0149 family protein [Thalassotalea sp. 1_MG-2023]
MSLNNSLDFASTQATITAESAELHASELHGMLTGLICGGYSFESNDYTTLIEDMYNNGESLSGAVRITLKLIFSNVWQSLLDDTYGFTPMLPDDDDSMRERGFALSAWVQGFNLGFGLQQKSNAVLSDDVKEVLNDFAEIANLSDEIDEDEATEQAYFEISEYVRISALLCFTELGTPPEPKDTSETVH